MAFNAILLAIPDFCNSTSHPGENKHKCRPNLKKQNKSLPGAKSTCKTKPTASTKMVATNLDTANDGTLPINNLETTNSNSSTCDQPSTAESSGESSSKSSDDTDDDTDWCPGTSQLCMNHKLADQVLETLT